MFTEATLIWALHNTIHKSDVLHTVLHYVSAIQYKCLPRNGENDEENLYQSVKFRYEYYPCGQMSDSLHPITPLKTWQIRVPEDFAVNITFVEFFLDEPISKDQVNEAGKCVLNNVTIQYYNYNANGTLCNIPGRTHCSWKAPWSVVVPSHHVVLHLTSVMVHRHYKMQYIYEVVEKCSDYFYLLKAHHIKYRRHLFKFEGFRMRSHDIQYNWVILGMPGNYLNLYIDACLNSSSPEMMVCDGPRQGYCNPVTNCEIAYITTALFHSFMYFHGTFHGNKTVNVKYLSTNVPPHNLPENKDHLFRVTNKGIPLFHKAWEITSNISVDIEFGIRKFTGPTEERCIYGGYSIYPSQMEYQYARTPHDSMLLRYYGPFCFSAPSVPLLDGGLPHLTLPNGTHKIVFYSFMDMFTIDLNVRITQNKNCTGHINICRLCLIAVKYEHFTVKAYDHLSVIRISCMPLINTGTILKVIVHASLHHKCVRLQHIAGDLLYPCEITIMGTHKIVFYSFMDMFTIDLNVRITQNKNCTGHINICRLCLIAVKYEHFTVKAYDHLSVIRISCMPLINTGTILKVIVHASLHHKCVRLQHIAGDLLYPCEITIMGTDQYDIFSKRSISFHYTYVPVVKWEYMYSNQTSCFTDHHSQTIISNKQREYLNISQVSADIRVGESKAWFVHMRTKCAQVYGTALMYTVGMNEKQVNPCKAYTLNRTGIIIEPHVACGLLHFSRPVVFTYMLSRLFHRYNIDIFREGICKFADKVRFIDGIKQKQFAGICEEEYHVDYISLLYNTLTLNFNNSGLQFQVRSGHVLIQVIKSSSSHCNLTINYEICFQTFQYYKKRIRCIPMKNMLTRQNQVKHSLIIAMTTKDYRK